MLRISCASSWFLFTRLYQDELSAKHKQSYTQKVYTVVQYTVIRSEGGREGRISNFKSRKWKTGDSYLGTCCEGTVSGRCWKRFTATAVMCRRDGVCSGVLQPALQDDTCVLEQSCTYKSLKSCIMVRPSC